MIFYLVIIIKKLLSASQKETIVPINKEISSLLLRCS